MLCGASGRSARRKCRRALAAQILFYGNPAAPPLAQERKRRTKAGQPLTAIGADGYFIPIIAVSDHPSPAPAERQRLAAFIGQEFMDCLLYTSPSPRDRTRSRMPSSA